MSILEWIAHAKREFWNAGESRSLRSTLCETLDDLTRPTQLEIVENEWLLNYRDRKLGRNCYCCIDSQLAKGAEGRGALSEIKRVVNIPGYNNNLVQNVRKEFSPRGETFTHFPPSHSTRCIIRWKTAGGSRLVGLLSLRMIDEGRSWNGNCENGEG